MVGLLGQISQLQGRYMTQDNTNRNKKHTHAHRHTCLEWFNFCYIFLKNSLVPPSVCTFICIGTNVKTINCCLILCAIRSFGWEDWRELWKPRRGLAVFGSKFEHHIRPPELETILLSAHPQRSVMHLTDVCEHRIIGNSYACLEPESADSNAARRMNFLFTIIVFRNEVTTFSSLCKLYEMWNYGWAWMKVQVKNFALHSLSVNVWWKK
jgi:hypothetical protein